MFKQIIERFFMKHVRFFPIALLFSFIAMPLFADDAVARLEARINSLEKEVAELKKNIPYVVDAGAMTASIQEKGSKIEKDVIGKYQPKMEKLATEMQALQTKLADAKDDAKVKIQKELEDIRSKMMQIQQTAEAEMKKAADGLQKEAMELVEVIKAEAKKLGATTIVDKSVCIGFDDSFSKKVEANVNAASKKSKKSEEKSDMKSEENEKSDTMAKAGSSKKVVAFNKK